MLDKESFGKMRQIGVTKDAEKVKVRLKEAWLPLGKFQREEILELAGLSRYAVSRSYESGAISVKVALAVAQCLKINPFYLTGESDDRDGYSDEAVREFLIANKHASVIETDKPKPKRKYNRKPKPEAEAVAEKVEENLENVSAYVEAEPEQAVPVSNENKAGNAAETVKPEKVENRDDTAAPRESPDKLSFKKARKLLKGLYMRSEYNDDAKQTLGKIKTLLIE